LIPFFLQKARDDRGCVSSVTQVITLFTEGCESAVSLNTGELFPKDIYQFIIFYTLSAFNIQKIIREKGWFVVYTKSR